MDKKIYVDMDGTVAEWDAKATLDEVSTPGYFRHRVPMRNMIAALDRLKGEFDLVICSAALQDGHSVSDKKAWLKEHMPFIDIDRAVFVPYGTSKYACLEKEMAARGERPGNGDMFLDDYSKNLVDMRDMSAGRIVPVKVCNGINDTHRSWDGLRVSSASSPEAIACTLAGISRTLDDSLTA